MYFLFQLNSIVYINSIVYNIYLHVLGCASVHKEAATGPSVPRLPGASNGAGAAAGKL